MSGKDRDDNDDDGIPLPRETTALFGHTGAERALLDAYKGGRIPHAWLIGGPGGIGKATLAYRMARFVLAHPDPQAPAVQAATSLAVDPDDLVARRIAAQAHTSLNVLERVINEKTGKLFTQIRVEDARRMLAFFSLAAGEGGWRVGVIDSVDELNASSSNALLKVLEEPPERALLLLVSNAPGRLLPTIRSRCRRLMLRPLEAADVMLAAAAASGRAQTDRELTEAASAADGSVARALDLLEGEGLELRRKVLALLELLPDPDPRHLHALGDALGGTEPRVLASFIDIVDRWLAEHATAGAPEIGRAARFARAWEKINRAARDAETFNLERKPLVFNVFGLLAEAARG